MSDDDGVNMGDIVELSNNMGIYKYYRIILISFDDIHLKLYIQSLLNNEDRKTITIDDLQNHNVINREDYDNEDNQEYEIKYINKEDFYKNEGSGFL